MNENKQRFIESKVLLVNDKPGVDMNRRDLTNCRLINQPSL